MNGLKLFCGGGMTVNDLKNDAKQYLDWLIARYLDHPNEKEQYALQVRISFATVLGLISSQEAAQYCLKIGLGMVAEYYEKKAAIRMEVAVE